MDAKLNKQFIIKVVYFYFYEIAAKLLQQSGLIAVVKVKARLGLGFWFPLTLIKMFNAIADLHMFYIVLTYMWDLCKHSVCSDVRRMLCKWC